MLQGLSFAYLKLEKNERMNATKKLCLLDLDHTLIYGSYAPAEESELLFQYNEFLKVYKRPFAEEFVEFLTQNFDDIVVFTTAKEDYAEEICRLLKINPKKILARKECQSIGDSYYKVFRQEWATDYAIIHIVDDTPNVWKEYNDNEHQIRFIVPTEFRGEAADSVLKELIPQIRNFLTNSDNTRKI